MPKPEEHRDDRFNPSIYPLPELVEFASPLRYYESTNGPRPHSRPCHLRPRRIQTVTASDYPLHHTSAWFVTPSLVAPADFYLSARKAFDSSSVRATANQDLGQIFYFTAIEEDV